MFIARDTDETTFYLYFCMFLFDAVIWIKLPSSRNTHVSGSKKTVLSRLGDINYFWLDVVRKIYSVVSNSARGASPVDNHVYCNQLNKPSRNV